MSTLRKMKLRNMQAPVNEQICIDFANLPANDYISHHGILGMKWGVRRYQNKDGSLTSAGKKRYNSDSNDDIGKAPGMQSHGKSSRGIGKVAAAATGAALIGAAAVGPTKQALGIQNKTYRQMSNDELKADNARIALERNYKKNHDIKDSPADMINATNDAIGAVKKFRDADKVELPQNYNRYNTRKTLSQAEMDSMSDKDLQQLVNRLNLETQYSRLTQEPAAKSSVDVGLERTQAVLTVVGSAVTIGAGVATIAGAMGGAGPVASSAMKFTNR